MGLMRSSSWGWGVCEVMGMLSGNGMARSARLDYVVYVMCMCGDVIFVLRRAGFVVRLLTMALFLVCGFSVLEWRGCETPLK
jgi:hypothetical protein